MLMTDRRIRERVLSLLGAAACLAPSALATGTTAAATESPLERVYRQRYLSPEASVPIAPAASIPDAPASTSPSALSTVDASDPEIAAMMAKIEAYPPGASEDPPKPANPEIPIHPALTDKFFFALGGYYPTSTSEARLNSPSGIGTTVGFEDLLGLDNADLVPMGMGRWRMSDRWRLEVEHFGLNRSNSKVLTQDIIWGDQTFPSGTQIDAVFDVSVTRVSAGYSFFKTPDKEIGVALGFHVTNIKAEISGSGGGGADTGKILAPLPVLSGYGAVALTDKWAVQSRLDMFRLEYDPYKGHIFSIGVDVLYQPWRHLGMGVGWRGLDIGASATNNDWEGAVRSVFGGPIAFLSTSF
jgi:hypothetical protein